FRGNGNSTWLNSAPGFTRETVTVHLSWVVAPQPPGGRAAIKLSQFYRRAGRPHGPPGQARGWPFRAVEPALIVPCLGAWRVSGQSRDPEIGDNFCARRGHRRRRLDADEGVRPASEPC